MTERDETGANGTIETGANTPIAPVGARSVPLGDDSRTIPETPRAALIVALAAALTAAERTGDLALARVATATLTTILSSIPHG